MERTITCPQCNGTRLYKAGFRYLVDGSDKQRFLCRNCLYRFSIHKAKAVFRESLRFKLEECTLLQPVQNLKTGGIFTQQQPINNFEGKIVDFLWWMKKQGYKETTIISRGVRLRRLVNLGADLSDPEGVKGTIANQEHWKDSMKEVAVFAYDLYARHYEIKWERPRYKAIRQLPFIPQEREIDDVIAGCNQEIALFLQIGKETGARAGEIYRLQWTDIDFEGKTVSITAEKNSNPRIFRLSNKLYDMLCSYPKLKQKIFTRYLNLNNLRRTYQKHRKRTAIKLANPRLNKIMFHTLRHWKGSTEYHKTKDILHVMQVLGHKNIKNTLLYTQLLTMEKDDAFICKMAKEPIEIQNLIELGFEFVCDFEGTKFFKKRK